MNPLFEEYKQAKEATDRLASQLYSEFMSLKTIEEKFKLAYEYGTDYLREQGWYCPHVRTSEGEVSMYDDMYIERHQTIQLDDLISDMLSDLEVEWDHDNDKAMFESVYVEAINQDTPLAAVVRDMLDNGIRSGTFDW